MRIPVRALLAGVLLGLTPTTAAAATSIVTTNADSSDGACTVTLCSLRDAVVAANAAGGGTIVLSAATYTLSIPGADEDGALTGDLDLVRDLTIVGAGVGQTIIQAAPNNATTPIDRVFDVQRGGGLTLTGATVRYGQVVNGTAAGGAIRSAGRLELDDVAVTDSGVATSINSFTYGGAISIEGSTGDTTLLRTSVQRGYISAQNGLGGAISVRAGAGRALTITDSTISDSSSSTRAGAVYLESSTAVLTNVTIAGNSSQSDGAGLFVNGGSASTPVWVRFSTITGNVSSGGGRGGGLSVSSNAAPYTYLQRTVIAGNVDQYQNAIQFGTASCTGSAPVSLGGNVEDGSTCGLTDPTDRANAAVHLGLLQDNGGPVPTVGLLPGSAAIDPVAEVACPVIANLAAVPTDARGAQRPVNGGCDAGAYEAGPIGQADVRVTITGPNVAVAGDPIAYQAAVTNIGTAPATGVQLTWVLASGDSFVVPLGTLAAGASRTVDLHQVAVAGTRTLAAHVASITADADAANNDSSLTTAISGPGGIGSAGRPANTTPPSLTTFDTSAVCNPGVWDGSPTTFTYSWYHDGTLDRSLSGPAIPLSPTDYDHTYSCRVTATNAVGAGTSQSASVVVPNPTPVAVGTAATLTFDGTTLTCTAGTFAPPATAVAITWTRDGVDIDGAGTGTFTTTADDGGSTFTCRVTPYNGGVAGASSSSNPVTVPDLRPEPTLAVTGPAGTWFIGALMTCTVSAWTNGPPDTIRYAWYQGTTLIAGQTGLTYALVAGDIGHDVRCAAQGTSAVGTGLLVRSAALAIPDTRPHAVTVSIAGPSTPWASGSVLGCFATWNYPPSTIDYAWFRNGGQIAGASSSGYTLTADDVATDINCAVVGTGPGGRGGNASSSTRPIPGIVNVVPPSLDAAPVPGALVKCLPGTWRSRPTSLTRALSWKVDGVVTLPVNTTDTFRPTLAQVGRTLSCAVKQTSTYTSVTATASAVVGHAATQVDAYPTITLVNFTGHGPGAHGEVRVAVHAGGSQYVTLAIGLPVPLLEASSGAPGCTAGTLAGTLVCQSATGTIVVPVTVRWYGTDPVLARTTVAETDSDPLNDLASVSFVGTQPTATTSVLSAVIDPTDAEPGTQLTCTVILSNDPHPASPFFFTRVSWLRDNVEIGNSVAHPPTAAVQTYTVTPADVGHKIVCLADVASALNTGMSLSITPVAQVAPVALLSVAQVAVSVATGSAQVAVGCSKASLSCQGTLGLSVGPSLLVLSRSHAAKTVSIGSVRFTITGGKTVRVKVKLNARARAALKKRGYLRVTARMTYTTKGGPRKVVVRTIVLRRQ